MCDFILKLDKWFSPLSVVFDPSGNHLPHTWNILPHVQREGAFLTPNPQPRHVIGCLKPVTVTVLISEFASQLYIYNQSISK